VKPVPPATALIVSLAATETGPETSVPVVQPVVPFVAGAVPFVVKHSIAPEDVVEIVTDCVPVNVPAAGENVGVDAVVDEELITKSP
jgi:hypothetical protein